MNALKGILAGLSTLCFASNVMAESSFAEMQAKVGVETFTDACLDTLPSFDGTGPFLEGMVATKRSDSFWELGGGALSVSKHNDSGKSACIATIMKTDLESVMREIMAVLKRDFESHRTTVYNGKPTAFLETPGGPAAIVVIPASFGVTLMAQPKPN